MKDFFITLAATACAIGVAVSVLMGIVWGWQVLRVYIAEYTVKTETLRGEAELKRAEQNRKIQIEEARAKLDAAEFLNKAEIARAQGLAEATRTVAHSFGGPEAYLRYLWIQSIDNNKASVIYVPTEAGLPLLEAGKR